MRNYGEVPCLGISPFRFTPILLHDHDEYVTEDRFMEGLTFYTDLVGRLV